MTSNATRSTRLEMIAAFDSYDEAERFVDRLSDEGFPVDRVTIVGRDLELVERVTGRLNAARAALTGAVSVIPIALLFGWLFGVLFAPNAISVLTIVLYWVVVGIVVGALYGLLTYVILNHGQRNFASETGVRASRYEVLVDDLVADDAMRRLDRDRQRDPARAGSTRTGQADQRPLR